MSNVVQFPVTATRKQETVGADGLTDSERSKLQQAIEEQVAAGNVFLDEMPEWVQEHAALALQESAEEWEHEMAESMAARRSQLRVVR